METSYASRELKKLPITEAVHKIKEQVRLHQAWKANGGEKLKPSGNPPEGPITVIHQEVTAGKTPLDLDLSLDRNVTQIKLRTK